MRADFFFLDLDLFSSLAAVVGQIGIVCPYVTMCSSNLRRAEGYMIELIHFLPGTRNDVEFDGEHHRFQVAPSEVHSEKAARGPACAVRVRRLHGRSEGLGGRWHSAQKRKRSA